MLLRDATVAQLVEQLIRNQQVAGSSPASSSTKNGRLLGLPFFCEFILLIRTVPPADYFYGVPEKL